MPQPCALNALRRSIHKMMKQVIVKKELMELKFIYLPDKLMAMFSYSGFKG